MGCFHGYWILILEPAFWASQIFSFSPDTYTAGKHFTYLYMHFPALRSIRYWLNESALTCQRQWESLLCTRTGVWDCAVTDQLAVTGCVHTYPIMQMQMLLLSAGGIRMASLINMHRNEARSPGARRMFSQRPGPVWMADLGTKAHKFVRPFIRRRPDSRQQAFRRTSRRTDRTVEQDNRLSLYWHTHKCTRSLRASWVSFSKQI